MSYDIHHLMLCYSVMKGPVGGPIGDGSHKKFYQQLWIILCSI